MSRFNTLLHGKASEAAAILGGDRPDSLVDDISEIRSALTNALNRFDLIEQHAAYLVIAINDVREKARKE